MTRKALRKSHSASPEAIVCYCHNEKVVEDESREKCRGHLKVWAHALVACGVVRGSVVASTPVINPHFPVSGTHVSPSIVHRYRLLHKIFVF